MRNEPLRAHFQIDGLKFRPAGATRPRPLIYAGGESGPARLLAAEAADVWFLNGQSHAAITALIADARTLKRHGPPLRFGMSAFVIARPTAGQAAEALEYAHDLAHQDAPLLQKT